MGVVAAAASPPSQLLKALVLIQLMKCSFSSAANFPFQLLASVPHQQNSLGVVTTAKAGKMSE